MKNMTRVKLTKYGTTTIFVNNKKLNEYTKIWEAHGYVVGVNEK